MTFTDENLSELKKWNTEHADKRDLIFALIARLEAAERVIDVFDLEQSDSEAVKAWRKAKGAEE